MKSFVRRAFALIVIAVVFVQSCTEDVSGDAYHGWIELVSPNRLDSILEDWSFAPSEQMTVQFYLFIESGSASTTIVSLQQGKFNRPDLVDEVTKTWFDTIYVDPKHEQLIDFIAEMPKEVSELPEGESLRVKFLTNGNRDVRSVDAIDVFILD